MRRSRHLPVAGSLPWCRGVHPSWSTWGSTASSDRPASPSRSTSTGPTRTQR